jgi:hypothetical protein
MLLYVRTGKIRRARENFVWKSEYRLGYIGLDGKTILIISILIYGNLMKSVDWLQPAQDSFSLAGNGNGILCLRDFFKNSSYHAPKLTVSRGFSSWPSCKAVSFLIGTTTYAANKCRGLLTVWSVAELPPSGCWLCSRLQVISCQYVTDCNSAGLAYAFILNVPGLIPATGTRVESKKNKVFVSILTITLKTGMEPTVYLVYDRKWTMSNSCQSLFLQRSGAQL